MNLLDMVRFVDVFRVKNMPSALLCDTVSLKARSYERGHPNR